MITMDQQLTQLAKVSKLLNIRFDPDYNWTGMVSTHDGIITNWQGKTPEDVVDYLWKYVKRAGGFKKI